MTDVGLPFRQEGSASQATAFAGTSNASVGDFLALLKPRVMSLVVFTALTGMVMAPGHLHPVVAFASLLAIAVGAGASGALNMWYDADIDRVMTRTRERPVAAGRVTPDEALAFGLILSGLSVLTLGVVANWVAGGLLAFTILFYVVVYTMGLKRRTPQNIVIGGAAGAFPPMVAWSAVTGDVTLAPVVLFAIIFLWTPPHFWALALFKSGDYARAGVPMLPVVSGERETRRQVLLYSIVLAPLGVLPWWLGFASPVYGAASAALGAMFLVRAVAVWRETAGYRAAKGLFGYSILYLFGLFALLLGDAVVARLMASLPA